MSRIDPTARQGQGSGTPRKEEGFAIAFASSLHISKGGWRYPYWHIDLNSGSGWNDVTGCEGSPLVFAREAIKKSRHFVGMFCDNDPAAIMSLRQRFHDIVVQLPTGSELHFFPQDNGVLLEQASQMIESREKNPEFAFGTVLCDPNGYKKGFPRLALESFSRRFPRIDIILSYNVNLHRAARSCRDQGWKGFEDWPEPLDVIAGFGRQYWLVRNIEERGMVGHRFTTLVGRTTDKGSRRMKDFYPLNKKGGVGLTIFTELKRVPDRQELLFPEMED